MRFRSPLGVALAGWAGSDVARMAALCVLRADGRLTVRWCHSRYDHAALRFAQKRRRGLPGDCLSCACTYRPGGTGDRTDVAGAAANECSFIIYSLGTSLGRLDRMSADLVRFVGLFEPGLPQVIPCKLECLPESLVAERARPERRPCEFWTT